MYAFNICQAWTFLFCHRRHQFREHFRDDEDVRTTDDVDDNAGADDGEEEGDDQDDDHDSCNQLQCCCGGRRLPIATTAAATSTAAAAASTVTTRPLRPTLPLQLLPAALFYQLWLNMQVVLCRLLGTVACKNMQKSSGGFTTIPEKPRHRPLCPGSQS